MSDQWRVKIGSKAHGPFSIAAVQKLISSGKVTTETLVSEGTSSDWVPAGSIVTFFPANEAPEEWELEANPEQPVLPQIMPKRNRREKSENLANPGRLEPAATGSMTIPQVLFDFKFHQYATPMIARTVWIISIVIIALVLFITNAIAFFSAFQVISSSQMNLPEKLGILIFFICNSALTIIGAIILLLYNRVLCEIAIVAFDISDSLKSIDNKLSQAHE